MDAFIPPREEALMAIVADVRRVAMDAVVSLDERYRRDGEIAWSWRPDAGVKFSRTSFSGMTVARKPGHRGERGVNRNPSRRESRIASAEPVCSCAFSCALLHARPRVQRAPGFPCALLLLSRAAIDAKLGRIAPRECGRVFARCLKFESEECATICNRRHG